MNGRRILLLGADGQIGWELRRALLPLGTVLACSRTQADLAQLDSLQRLLDEEQPAVIVNAAAYTAVDRAETETDLAHRINADAPEVCARWAAERGAWLVHYSTDYVFDGRSEQPYDEASVPSPLSSYGRSKLAGEQAIVGSGCKHLIFRTSWVYALRGNNFAHTMLRLGREREQLRVVADQVGAPTSAELIADVTALALHRMLESPSFAGESQGLYHLAASGSTSWHGYAQYLLERAAALGQELRCKQVHPIGTADYPLPAPRPMNSRLDCSLLCRRFGISLPDWRVQVARFVSEAAQVRHGT